MNPRQFLQVGGIILLLLGIVGFVKPDLLPGLLEFDAAENYAHTVLGIVALLAAYTLGADLQKWLTVVVGVVALFFGVMGFVVSGNPAPNFYGIANLENPLDNVVHLVVGVWALWAAMGRSMA
jgi:hypothetical protein